MKSRSHLPVINNLLLLARVRPDNRRRWSPWSWGARPKVLNAGGRFSQPSQADYSPATARANRCRIVAIISTTLITSLGAMPSMSFRKWGQP